MDSEKWDVKRNEMNEKKKDKAERILYPFRAVPRSYLLRP